LGNYRKPLLTLWSTTNYTNLIHWQDESPSSYLNCLAWNPINTNEFCLGSSNGTIHFCTIIEETNRLQVINRQINESCDITACIYLTSIINLVLCATNSGLITCWNSHLCLCIFHWKGDVNEICYMTTIKHRLVTGSSTGCLKLWNIENLQANLTQLNSVDS
jgi:WD40 repeat protein